MSRKHTDKKEILVIVLSLLVGAALTATSFCVYYLVKPQNAAILSVICVVDFIYNLITTCLFLKSMNTEKWLLKGILIAIGYIAAFIVIALAFISISGAGAIEFLKNNILGIVFYSFFTAPCMYVVILILLLFLSCG